MPRAARLNVLARVRHVMARGIDGAAVFRQMCLGTPGLRLLLPRGAFPIDASVDPVRGEKAGPVEPQELAESGLDLLGPEPPPSGSPWRTASTARAKVEVAGTRNEPTSTRLGWRVERRNHSSTASSWRSASTNTTRRRGTNFR